MILITGANGHLGTATIDFLLQQVPAATITALVRDIAKATELRGKGVGLRTGDYTDPASLTQAFKAVDTLVLISSGSLENRVQQHINAIDAAKANGVKHIIYTSVLKPSEQSKFTAGIDHFHTEAYLQKSGIPYTSLRNTYYTELLPMLAGDALNSGNWYYAAGQSKVNFASRLDMATALANVALHTNKHINQTYEITGSKAYSFTEIAQVLSDIVGKTITYIPVSVDELQEGLRKGGLPEAYIPLMTSVAASIEAGEFDVTDPVLEQLLGRKPTDIAATLKTLLAVTA